jgi:hypothetical protein
MPSVSKAQQRLMGAAEHGATFPMAQKLRASMSHQQLHDFASGPMKGKPAHVKKGSEPPKPSEPHAGKKASHPGLTYKHVADGSSHPGMRYK